MGCRAIVKDSNRVLDASINDLDDVSAMYINLGGGPHLIEA